MKIQDMHPIDSTIPGLNNIYLAIGEDTHYINSPCIVAKNKIVRTGSTYLLSMTHDTPDINIFAVQLKDVSFNSGYVYLLLINLLTGRIFDVSHIVRPTEGDCEWKLIDLTYLSKIITNQRSNANNEDKLLEFEF